MTTAGRTRIDPMMRRTSSNVAAYTLAREWLISRLGDLEQGRTFECPGGSQCSHDTVDECVIVSLIAYADGVLRETT